MSLILEALRKSEAERRRGVAPDVAMELPPLPVLRARGLPAWLWPVVLLAGIALAAAWLWSRPAPDVAAEPPPIAAVAPPPATGQTEPRVVVQTYPRLAAPPPVAVAPQPVQSPPAQSAAREVAPPPQIVPPPIAPIPPPQPAVGMDAAPMPAVKLSMHIWDESPARRFVILDGQRMVEGDRNGDLRVVAIERDGVVVERNGVRGRVPLP